MKLIIKYEISLPLSGNLAVELDDMDFEDMEDSDISDAIGEAIQEHFDQNVSWCAKDRKDIVSQIIAARGGDK